MEIDSYESPGASGITHDEGYGGVLHGVDLGIVSADGIMWYLKCSSSSIGSENVGRDMIGQMTLELQMKWIWKAWESNRVEQEGMQQEILIPRLHHTAENLTWAVCWSANQTAWFLVEENCCGSGVQRHSSVTVSVKK